MFEPQNNKTNKYVSRKDQYFINLNDRLKLINTD